MRCYIAITGSSTVLVLSTLKSATDPGLVKRLKANDIEKMILLELPLDLVKESYGETFQEVSSNMGDMEFRVLDFNGASIFRRFTFADMGQPLMVEF